MFKAHGSTPDNPPKPFAATYYAGNLVLRGRGEYSDWNGQTHKLLPGSFFQRIPGKIHHTWYDPKSDYAEFFVWFDVDTAASLMQLELLNPLPVVNAGMNQMVCDRALQIYDQIALPDSELASSTLLMHVLNFIHELYERGRQHRRKDFWNRIVMDACAALERDLSDRQSLQQIAEQQRVEYSAFRKNFKRIMGMSPGEYRIRKRLDRACLLLMEHPVKQVAAELGYPDPYTFSTQFRTFVGMAPQHYKRTMEPTSAPRARRYFKGRPIITEAEAANPNFIFPFPTELEWEAEWHRRKKLKPKDNV